jgi:hypothetical protein
LTFGLFDVNLFVGRELGKDGRDGDCVVETNGRLVELTNGRLVEDTNGGLVDDTNPLDPS